MGRPSFHIIFMGTPDFAIPTLSALIQGPDHICAIVTQPDRARGRSKKLVAPPIKVLAEEHGIPVHQPTKIRTVEFADLLRGYNPDIIVVTAYGRILPPAILSRPSDTMEPHAGVGGGIPAPRKLRVASSRMTIPTWRVATIISVFMMPGNICMNKILGVDAPATLAKDT